MWMEILTVKQFLLQQGKRFKGEFRSKLMENKVDELEQNKEVLAVPTLLNEENSAQQIGLLYHVRKGMVPFVTPS